MFDKFKDYPLMKDRQGNVPMFYPHIPKNSLKSLKKVLAGRWIGQGPLVDIFEKKFEKRYYRRSGRMRNGRGSIYAKFALFNKEEEKRYS